MKYLTRLIICITFSLITACKTTKPLTTESFDQIYQNAVKDAMYPEANKVDTSLIDITSENRNLIHNPQDTQYILVVTWKTQDFYKTTGEYNTDTFDIWVTVAPELLERMNNEKVQDKYTRLKQMLGLPPSTTPKYEYFTEFWVKPGDLFRPCPDQEITDKKCNTCFPDNFKDTNYLNWFNANRIDRYYKCDLFNKFPWTQLGYTYDWNSNNKTHKGLSEFVIRRHKKILVHKIYKTDEYFAKKYD